MPSDSTRSTPELLSTVISEVTSLFRKELQLARAEMGEKVGKLSGSLVPLGAGAALLLGAMIVLLFAAVALLVSFGLHPGWASLIVAVLAAAIGYALLKDGLSQITATNLIPSRAAQQLSHDAQLMKEQVR